MSLDRLTAALADRYTIEHEVGAGGMATVYLAHDLRHDRRIALKVLRPELAAVIGGERFLKEIKVTANLQHPHILGLIDSGETEGLLWYAMPFVEGESLRDRLVREKQLPIPDAVRIAIEVAAALDYAHRHGVIHRDIKPENVLLHDGSALVADFGIALAASTAGTRMTETGMSLGTPHYMSPEQAMGEREITARSDVYALGCITYEMLVGEPPFTGPTAQAIIARVMTEEPRRLTMQRKSIPPEVEAAVFLALEKLPADRFASAAHFADALSGKGATITTRAITSAAAAETRIASWRRRFLVASAVAAVALGLAGWGWMRAQAAAGLPFDQQYLALGDSVQSPNQPALSPDGSLLAFVGDSLARLWIKRTGSLDPVLLPGTEGATNPVFSPDGQWVAYASGGYLKKVRAGGGASVTIADSVTPGFGLAWLDDETLVYPSASLLGLRRVSASGGPVTVVLSDTLFKGLSPLWPTALPKARGVLFSLCSSGCLTTSLYVLELNTGVAKRLLDDVAGGWYLGSGQLLFLRRDGVALVNSFDLGTLEVSGAAVPVLQNVATGRLSSGAAGLTWSTSGRLVYASGAATIDIVALQHQGRNDPARSFDPSWKGRFNSFALSPDGRRAAVSIGAGGNEFDIWIKQLDTGPLTRLTFSGRDRRPTWSPNGREVAFVRDSTSGGDVYVRAVDGSGSDRRLAHLDRAIQEVTWSRDGRWLLVRTETSAAGSGDILALSTTGDSAVLSIATGPFTEMQPALSPDGRWVAYVSNEAGVSQVFVRPFPNAESGRWQVSNGGGLSPVWANSGRELFFLDGANRLVAAQLGVGTAFKVTALTPLFDATQFSNPGFHQAFEVTSDGRFAFLGSVGPVSARAPGLVQVDNWFADIRARLK